MTKRTAGLALLLLFVVPLRVMAGWQDVGRAASPERHGDRFIFRTPVAVVSLTVLSPDLVRVRMVRGRSFPQDYSWAVSKKDWPATPVEASLTPAAAIIRTNTLQVRVSLSPLRLAFYDRAGRLISKDADDRGMSFNGERVRVWKQMPPDEHYFGLGEKAGPLDRRGRAFVMWNTDAYGWGATTDPLYDTIPFFIALRAGRAYGVFFDNTYRSSFDMGVEFPDLYSFGAEGGELNYYFFYGPDPKTVLERYTELVGRMKLPARWAIGYHQSRYSYYPEKVVRFIADNFRIRRIPCDAIFLDIHYMNGYRVFTWNKSRFPDPPKLMRDLHREGFHVVTIIDPGVKVDPNYWVYRQGLDGNDFVKLPAGRLYVGSVWPGPSVFPDFTWNRVRQWWGSLYQGLIADGVDGFWNDMNEPAIFNVPSKTMPADVVFHDHGLDSPHSKIHNVYGMLMSEATEEGMLKLRPAERALVITRDTYAGGELYAAVWTGDNSSTWTHLELSLPEIMSMGLSGLALAGADIGGFAGSPSPDLYTRWLEAGAFYPYCRTHTAIGTRNQEPWSYGNRREEINRTSIKLRYRLLPYLYNAFYQASETGLPVMRALLLDYPNDLQAIGQDDEFLFGDDLLVAPVVKDGEWRWDAYLPKGAWYDFWTDRRYDGPRSVSVDAPLDRVPLFVRGGAIIPTEQPMEYTGEAPINPLTLEIYPDGASSRSYYEDDGISFDYERGSYLKQIVSVSPSAARLDVHISARQGSYKPPGRPLVFKIHALRPSPRIATVDGKLLRAEGSSDALDRAASGWFYDSYVGVAWIKIPDRGREATIRLRW